MPISTIEKAIPLLKFFEQKALDFFGDRIISLFKFGSLGDRGDFSLCSDVDVALMLNEINDEDEAKIKKLCDEIKNSHLEYSDRFSLFWCTYNQLDFDSGKGRLPALDRLDFLQHAVLMKGVDRRKELVAPPHDLLVLESAKFILSLMLAGERLEELTMHPNVIMQKGARYFTKFVLFPVRLIFTLDHPNVIATNRDAVEYHNKKWSHDVTPELTEVVNVAYGLRNVEPTTEVLLDEKLLYTALLDLYKYCINRYYHVMISLNQKDLAQQLQDEMKKIN